MVVVEAIAGALLVALLVAAVGGAFVGILGVLAGVRLDRCNRCRHLGLSRPGEAPGSCGHCRARLLPREHHSMAKILPIHRSSMS